LKANEGVSQMPIELTFGFGYFEKSIERRGAISRHLARCSEELPLVAPRKTEHH
jgi:hypothetical protein